MACVQLCNRLVSNSINAAMERPTYWAWHADGLLEPPNTGALLGGATDKGIPASLSLVVGVERTHAVAAVNDVGSCAWEEQMRGARIGDGDR